MRRLTDHLRLFLAALGLTSAMCLHAEASSVTIENVNYVSVIAAPCDDDVEQWSLVADLGVISLNTPYLLRMTRPAAFLRVNAPSIKKGAKQAEPNLALRIAIVYRSLADSSGAPPDYVHALLHRSYRTPRAVSGQCNDANNDGHIMAFECDPALEDAMYSELGEHGQAVHTELAVRAWGGYHNATLRACVAASPASSVGQAGLVALLGTGTNLVEQ